MHVDQDGAPFGLAYFVAPVPHGGACPSPSKRSQRTPNSKDNNDKASGPGLAALRPIANTTVVLRAPSFPPLYVLAHPDPPPAYSCPFPSPRARPVRAFSRRSRF